MRKPKVTMTEVRLITNRVMGPSMTGKYYFVRKAKLVSGDIYEVVGQKVDVTDSVEALLEKERSRAKSRRRQGA